MYGRRGVKWSLTCGNGGIGESRYGYRYAMVQGLFCAWLIKPGEACCACASSTNTDPSFSWGSPAEGGAGEPAVDRGGRQEAHAIALASRGYGFTMKAWRRSGP